jgi:hypothetical protein
MVNDDTIRRVGTVLLVRCGHAPLDGAHGGSAMTAAEIADRARSAGVRTILLDATGAPYADSDGLRWLLRLKQEVEASDIALCAVAAPHGKVWRNLALLDAGLEMYDDLHVAWDHAAHPARYRGVGVPVQA